MSTEILDVNTLFGAFPSKHPDSTAESLVTTLDAQTVQWCLTLSTVGLFHSDVLGNAETMRACRSLDHLIPVATMNPRSYFGQVDVIEQVLAQSFEMFRFFPHVQHWPYDFAPFQDILAVLAATKRTPIMISIKAPGDLTVLARVLANYPHPVIIDGVTGDTLSEAISVMRTNPRLFIETHGLCVPDALLLLRDTVGISRVLFGSEAPGMQLGSALRYVRRSTLSEADQAAVLGANAQLIWAAGEGS